MAGFNKRFAVRAALIGLVLALLGAAVFYFLLREKAGISEWGLPLTKPAAAAVYSTAEWNPEREAADEEGFVAALGTEELQLLIHPETTQVKVVDLRSGIVWRSNRTEAELEGETVKGTLLANLKSPFIMEYTEAGTVQRQITNALRKQAEYSFVRYEGGLQVNYRFPDLDIGFALQYELAGGKLRAGIPAASVAEAGKYQLLAIGLLPSFGSAGEEADDGYLFVPDGPGGIIAFRPGRAVIGEPYNYPVYGNDWSNLREDLTELPREPIRFPVYGIKRGEGAFAAVLAAGEHAAWIRAYTPGMQARQYQAYAQFIYRVDYAQRLSKMSEPVRAFQQEPLLEDRAVEFYFLHGAEAGYTGMAHAYQRHLLESGQLPARLDAVGSVPLELAIAAGNTVYRYGRHQYVPATTFAEASRIVEALQQSGAGPLRISIAGWQHRGYYDRLNRFPVEAKLGGNAGARSFIAQVQAGGGAVLLEDDPIWADQEAGGITRKGDGVRGIDNTVYTYGNAFALTFPLAAALLEKTAARAGELGADGLLLAGIGEGLFSDFNSARPLSRAAAAGVYRQMLETASELGEAGVYGGNAYTLGAATLIRGLPLAGNRDFIVDEQVPFYPIVLHGYVAYSGIPGNLRSGQEQAGLLRAIEYGALPAFVLTYDSPAEVREWTGEFLYSSQFSVWEARIVAEYGQFNRLAAVYHERIVGHEQQEPGVYVTTYEGGTQVLTDYNRNTWAIIREGGADGQQ